MEKGSFPANTKVAVKLNRLIKNTGNRPLSERMSSRMVKCASVMEPEDFLGWQMAVPTTGLATIALFGTKEVSREDLTWTVEKTSTVVPQECRGMGGAAFKKLSQLYEIYLPVSQEGAQDSSIGFGGSLRSAGENDFSKWPASFSGQFGALTGMLRETGAILRVVLGPASEQEQSMCLKSTLRSYDVHGVDVKDYVGHPVKLRVLLLLPSAPSLRLKTILEDFVRGARLRYLGELEKETTEGEGEVERIWSRPLSQAPVLPDYAARILMLEPEVNDVVIGLQTCEPPMKKIYASHKNTLSKKAVEIGRATDTSGLRRKITIGEMDLKRHYQIVGQTGTGKSTLLANLILSAVEQGHGLTFFDPHGSTIDVVLRCLPGKYANVRVVPGPAFL